MALLAATLFAQTGSIYLPTAAETAQAKTLYGKVEAASKALADANDAWGKFKSTVAVSHGLSEKDYITFNGEFTTFSAGYAAYVTYASVTCGSCCVK